MLRSFRSLPSSCCAVVLASSRLSSTTTTTSPAPPNQNLNLGPKADDVPIAWEPAAKWTAPTPVDVAHAKSVHSVVSKAWRTHPTYASSGAERFIKTVHGSLRSRVRDITEAAGKKTRVDLREFNKLVTLLQKHHLTEDGVWFPLLFTKATWTKRHFEYLEMDHKHLNTLEAKVTQEGGTVASFKEFATFVDYHFTREEMVVVPLYLNGYAPSKWRVMLQQYGAPMTVVAVLIGLGFYARSTIAAAEETPY